MSTPASQSNLPLQKKALALLSLGHFTTDMATGAVPVLLPLLKAAFGLSYTATGVISLMYNVSSSVIQPLLGYWSDRVQSRWLLPAGLVLTMAGLALSGIVPNYQLLLMVILLSGLGSAAYHPEGSKVAHLASGSRRATGMSLFILGGTLGASVGSLTTGLLVTWHGRAGVIFYLIPGLIVAAVLLLYISKLPPDPIHVPKKPADSKVTPAPVVKPSFNGAMLILILAVVMRSWTQAGLMSFIPFYYVSHLGYSPAYASSMLVAFMLAGSVGNLIGGPLADRFGKKGVFSVSLFLLVPILMVFRYSSGITALITLFIAGAVIVSSMGVTVVMGQELMPHRIGVASGLMTGFAIGMGGIGVTLLGAVADHWGVPTAILVISLLPLAGAVLSLFLPNDRKIKKITAAA